MVIVVLCVYLGFPALALSQEDTSSQSAEPTSESPELQLEENSNSTFTDWWLHLFLGETGQDSDPTHTETFGDEGEEPLENPDEDINSEDENDAENDELLEDSGPFFTPPPSPPLKTRRYGIEVFPDPKADHSCEVETLRVDLTEQSFAFRKIFLETYPGFSYSMEIGSLPDGIDVVFSETKIHLLHTDIPLTEATVEISKQLGARQGDFSIPIIFFERGVEDSTFICQLNIANR